MASGGSTGIQDLMGSQHTGIQNLMGSRYTSTGIRNLMESRLTIHDSDGDGAVRTEESAPRLVVAIDFGTFASGYALQWRSDFISDRLKIQYNTKWQTGGFCTYKTPTCLLLRPDRTLQAFGYTAEQEFSQLEMGDHNPSDWYFFKQFKMTLYRRDGLTDDTPVEDYHGKSLPVIEVFSKSIRYMKEHVINQLKENGIPYPETETKWVLTVPAIWDDPAKQVMRRSAEKAGINGDKLAIALEPEAAAIYCSQISDAQLEIEGDEGQLKHVAAPGSTVMVVDMGGGTVDITTVKIESDGTMKQIFEAGGGAWGGMKVDLKFTQLLQTVVGTDTLAEFSRSCLLDEYELRMEFESKKREIRQKPRHGGDDKFLIKLPPTLKDMWVEKTGMNVMNIIAEQPKLRDMVELKRGRLVFNADTIREFFQEVIAEIVQYVNTVLKDDRHTGVTINSLILVGGFAESNIVVQGVRDGLGDRGIPVVRPQSTELAVLNGAVLFGQNEAILTSRVLRFTYGIGMIMEYSSDIHSEDKRFEADGKLWARDVFRKHVTRGDEIKLGEWIALKEYYPLKEDQTTTTVYVYISDQKNPRYITDPGCKYIGKLDVKFTEPAQSRVAVNAPPPPRRKKAVQIAMHFGGTELKIQAVDRVGKQRYVTSIKLT